MQSSLWAVAFVTPSGAAPGWMAKARYGSPEVSHLNSTQRSRTRAGEPREYRDVGQLIPGEIQRLEIREPGEGRDLGQLIPREIQLPEIREPGEGRDLGQLIPQRLFHGSF